MKITALVSALLGIAGTTILFLYSYAFEPREGAVFGSESVTAYNLAVKARNRSRLLWQRVGFGFLVLSYIAQVVLVLWL